MTSPTDLRWERAPTAGLEHSLKKLCATLLAVAAFVSCWSQPNAHADDIWQLTGQASTGVGGWNLTLSANLSATDATGFASLLGGATGPITQIIPPTDDPASFWCINIVRTDTLPISGNQRTNFYVRDIGDGITSFDQFAVVSGIGIDCSFPTRDLHFIPMVEGNFTTNVIRAGVPEGGSAIMMFSIALIVMGRCCSSFGRALQ